MAVSFSVGESSMKDIQLETVKNNYGKVKATGVVINGEKLMPTDRFMKSWQMRFRIKDTILKLYSPVEVFERISKVYPNDKIRWCIERVTKEDGTKLNPRALAVTNPNNSFVPYNTLAELLEQNGTDGKLEYSNGVIRSKHIPRVAIPFEICGDTFENRFVLDTPIDGFGRPQIYVSLLRLICSNGAIGYAPAFRSEISFGKKNDTIEFALQRALQNFNNPDGFAVIRDRFTHAANSWASVSEVMGLHKVVVQQFKKNGFKKSVGKLVIGSASENTEFDGSGIMRKFVDVTGGLNQQYGVANIDALSEKKQRVLPSKVKVYDVLNLASEMASHHANPSGARAIQAFIGQTISNEYDLEDSCDKFSDFRDFFIGSEETADVMASMSQR